MPTATLDQDTQRQERLARLAANRSVPPTNGRTAVTRTARRHAARGSRMTALALSIATTGGLAYGFASADHAVASTATASVPTVPAATQPSANQPPAHQPPANHRRRCIVGRRRSVSLAEG